MFYSLDQKKPPFIQSEKNKKPELPLYSLSHPSLISANSWPRSIHLHCQCHCTTFPGATLASSKQDDTPMLLSLLSLGIALFLALAKKKWTLSEFENVRIKAGWVSSFLSFLSLLTTQFFFLTTELLFTHGDQFAFPLQQSDIPSVLGRICVLLLSR